MKSTTGKRAVLFITPDYMDYTSIILDGITEYADAETSLVTTTGKKLMFAYKNTFHRIQNFFSKLIFNQNQKKLFYNKEMRKRLETIFKEHQHFDDVFILRPDLIKEHLPSIKKHSTRMIAYFWDSFSRIPEGRETIKYFDKFFSFEPKNVKDHDLLFLSNFYSPDLQVDKNIDPSFALSYVASSDNRLPIMERILDSLSHLQLKTNINIVANEMTTPKKEKNITWFTDALPRKETIRIMNNSHALLDIAQPNQTGLSFRIFEAMKLEKKIITTNRSVVDYDFYDTKNIFVWENENTIPERSFFSTPYSPLPVEVLNKYSLQKWITTIFE